MDTTGSVSFVLKSKPNQLTALNFGSLLIGDGCMVITFGGESITHSLDDVEQFSCRLIASQPNKNIAADRDG
jgi:hypothetical protein